MSPEHSQPMAAAPSLIQPITSIVGPLVLDRLFVRAQPLELELGSGDGSFIVHYAASLPGHNFIAVERLLGRLRKIDRKGRRAGLTNLKAIRLEAAYFIEYLMPPATVCALHVYFPDPWPKRRHRHHRLVNERFPELAARVLELRGVVYLRTDDGDYLDQMNTLFGASNRFRPVETPVELRNLPTDFEQDFQAKGIRTLHSAYELVN